jgi:hypothetical protein
LKFATPPEERFDAIHVAIHEGLILHILNGGYPVNFDRKKDPI